MLYPYFRKEGDSLKNQHSILLQCVCLDELIYTAIEVLEMWTKLCYLIYEYGIFCGTCIEFEGSTPAILTSNVE